MKRALVAAMLSALATGAVLATVGFGADSTATTSKKKTTTSAQSTQSGPPKTMKQVHEEMQARKAAQEKKLADALGVSTSDLKAAQEKLRQDKLDAEVKANRLTQAQADAIVKCDADPLTCDRSNLPAGGPGGRHGGGRHGGGMKGARGTAAADLAKALGIETAKVEKALQDTRPERPTQGGMPGRGHHGGHGGGPGGPPGGGGFGG